MPQLEEAVKNKLYDENISHHLGNICETNKGNVSNEEAISITIS